MFGGVNSTTNNNDIFLFPLLFGPRFIGWVGGWFRRNPTIAEFFNKKTATWIQKCAPRWLLGGSLAAPRWIVVMGRDFLYTQKTSGFTLRFAFGWRANGPRPPTYPPHPPTYGFMAQFFTTCIIFSSFFEKMLLALGGDHIFEHQPIGFCIKNTTFSTPIGKEKE